MEQPKTGSMGLELEPEVRTELQRLLYPDTDTRPVTIQLIFGYKTDPQDPRASGPLTVPKLLEERVTRRIQKSRETIYWTEFQPHEYHELYAAYQSVEAWPIKEIRINGYALPFAGSLWLPLLFFYLAEPRNPFVETPPDAGATPPEESSEPADETPPESPSS